VKGVIKRTREVMVKVDMEDRLLKGESGIKKDRVSGIGKALVGGGGGRSGHSLRSS